MRQSLVMLALAGACAGPPASDAAICRDVAHRICISECTTEKGMLQLAANMPDCDAVLNARTTCDDESFKFQSRDNFLSCRLPIIRNGDEVEAKPACTDIDDMFRGCPDLLTFYRPR